MFFKNRKCYPDYLKLIELYKENESFNHENIYQKTKSSLTLQNVPGREDSWYSTLSMCPSNFSPCEFRKN